MIAASLAFVFLQQGLMSPIEATYHLRVEELDKPLDWHGHGYVVSAKPPTTDQLAKYEPIFIKEWSLYPPSLIEKTHVHRIVFGIELAVDGQARAAVPAFDGDTMYYDPVLGSHSLHYQRIVVHHEFFHMIDERMKLMRKDPEWSKLNVPDFHYGPGGKDMRGKGVGELTDKIPGFLTAYGTAAIEEDKAAFAHAVVDGPFVAQRAKADPVLAAKLALLRKRLEGFDPAMGDGFWEQISEREGQVLSMEY